MRRIAALCISVVLLASCGGADGQSSGPSSTSSGAEPPVLIAFTGTPPIWPISNEEFDRIIGGLSALYYPDAWERYGPVTEACRDLEGSRPEGNLITGNAPIEGCLRPYLKELGVAEEALGLFFASGILVWDAQQVGPFWSVYGTDYDAFGTEDFAPDYLFTPDGIFDVPEQFTSSFPVEGWAPLVVAREEALAAPRMEEMRDAYAEQFGIGPDEVAFWPYGETIDLASPSRSDDGWVVPFTWRLLGCHACTTPIIGNFALDAASDGSIVGVRFLDLCLDRRFASSQPEDIALSRGGFGLPDCG